MVTVHGVDKNKFYKFRNYNLSEQGLLMFRNRKDAALIGATIAKRKNWEVGQVLDLRSQLGILLTVSSIFFTGNEELDNAVLIDFEYAQDCRDKRGWANLIYVKLREGSKPEEVAAKIDLAMSPIKTRTRGEKIFLSSMLEDLNDMMNISRLIVLITLVVVLAGIANSISISVRDRTAQIGVMRTLGFKRKTVLSLILAEASLVSVVGGLIGCISAFVVFQVTEVTIQTRIYNFAISLTGAVILYSITISVIVGLLGGFAPALHASRLKIVESIRSIN